MARFRLNPLTGLFDWVSTGSGSGPNFSYTYIPPGTTITVPAGQQMLVVGDITIDGELVIDGEVIQL